MSGMMQKQKNKHRVILNTDREDVVFLDGLVERGVSASRNALITQIVKAFKADIEKDHKCPDLAIAKLILFAQKMGLS